MKHGQVPQPSTLRLLTMLCRPFTGTFAWEYYKLSLPLAEGLLNSTDHKCGDITVLLVHCLRPPAT